MNNFSDLVAKRRSIRKFTTDPLTPEQVATILKSGLMSPTSKNGHSWEFIAIEDKDLLHKLSTSKQQGSKLIEGCALAVIVLVDPSLSDVWIEDASIASILMQMQAEDLGIGSCWVQIRNRYTSSEEDESASEYIKSVFNIPVQYQVLSVIAFGNKEQEKLPFDEEKLLWDKIHINKF